MLFNEGNATIKDELFSFRRSYGAVCLDNELFQVHSWGILNVYTALSEGRLVLSLSQGKPSSAVTATISVLHLLTTKILYYRVFFARFEVIFNESDFDDVLEHK